MNQKFTVKLFFIKTDKSLNSYVHFNNDKSVVLVLLSLPRLVSNLKSCNRGIFTFEVWGCIHKVWSFRGNLFSILTILFFSLVLFTVQTNCKVLQVFTSCKVHAYHFDIIIFVDYFSECVSCKNKCLMQTVVIKVSHV